MIATNERIAHTVTMSREFPERVFERRGIWCSRCGPIDELTRGGDKRFPHDIQWCSSGGECGS